MNYKEFITLASQGKKLRDKTWLKDEWIQMRDDGSFVNHSGHTLHYQPGNDFSEFEIYHDPITLLDCLSAESVAITFHDGVEASTDHFDRTGGWSLDEISDFDFAIKQNYEIKLS